MLSYTNFTVGFNNMSDHLNRQPSCDNLAFLRTIDMNTRLWFVFERSQIYRRYKQHSTGWNSTTNHGKRGTDSYASEVFHLELSAVWLTCSLKDKAPDLFQCVSSSWTVHRNLVRQFCSSWTSITHQITLELYEVMTVQIVIYGSETWRVRKDSRNKDT
jgi:hypothetical protein